jgi:hypothetical protein
MRHLRRLNENRFTMGARLTHPLGLLGRSSLSLSAFALVLLLGGALCSAHRVADSTAHYRHHGAALLNDLTVTPGAVRTTSVKEICGETTPQFRKTTPKMKAQVYAYYGVDKDAALKGGPKPSKDDADHPLYEVDHLISLELGGADDIRNLWPQPYYEHPGAHEKDVLEGYLRRQVCAGKITPTAAQQAIRLDWYKAYLDAHIDPR